MASPPHPILTTLKAAREMRGMSQRKLADQVGLPQSHVSKIETGGTDLRLSSLVELARALELELVLIPRHLLPAIVAMTQAEAAPMPAYSLDDDDEP